MKKTKKTDLELRVPRSARAYYVTQAVEIIIFLGLATITYYLHFPIVASIFFLLLLYFPIKSMLRPKYLVMNDDGIYIYGYHNPGESMSIQWKEITDIHLEHNNREGAISIYFRQWEQKPLYLDLEDYMDLSDIFHIPSYFARHNKRIRDLLAALCKKHSVYFKAN